MDRTDAAPRCMSDDVGADAWFDRIFDETKDAMLRFIFVHTGDPDSVDDIFQEVYSQLFQRIRRKGWKDIQEPAAFLTTIAKREISRHRQSKRHREATAPEIIEPIVPCPEDAFEKALENRSMVEEIRAAVRRMPERTYKVFTLYYFFDMTVAQIAMEMEMTENAVKCRLNRARNYARRIVKED